MEGKWWRNTDLTIKMTEILKSWHKHGWYVYDIILLQDPIPFRMSFLACHLVVNLLQPWCVFLWITRQEWACDKIRTMMSPPPTPYLFNISICYNVVGIFKKFLSFRVGHFWERPCLLNDVEWCDALLSDSIININHFYRNIPTKQRGPLFDSEFWLFKLGLAEPETGATARI